MTAGRCVYGHPIDPNTGLCHVGHPHGGVPQVTPGNPSPLKATRVESAGSPPVGPAWTPQGPVLSAGVAGRQGGAGAVSDVPHPTAPRAVPATQYGAPYGAPQAPVPSTVLAPGIGSPQPMYTSGGWPASPGYGQPQPVSRKTVVATRPVEKSPPIAGCLVVLEGPCTAEDFRLRIQQNVLGTDPVECHVCIPGDDQISRKHAALTVDAERQFILQDLASTNGTWVNGERIYGKKLEDNDEITLGKTTFKFKKL